ncbi:MAG: 4Fe-4S dicluster domain-containing protein [Desulfobacterota bacterium]|nr:4Fe-4S dicluster domain-containing protein [Thermodesulfobacteriota bacterium]
MHAGQIGFYFDQTRCTGCYACVIACRDWHDIRDTKVQWRSVIAHEWGKYPDVGLAYASLSCMHCSQPACRDVCPVSAIRKRDSDGVVLVDRDLCLGGKACGKCREACPYEIPQFGTGDDDRMQKCTFCVDRIDTGEQPVCVLACPMYALDWGPIDELRRKYGTVQHIYGFSLASEAQPSIVLKFQSE